MGGKDRCVYKGGFYYNIIAFFTSLLCVTSFLKYFIGLKLALLFFFFFFPDCDHDSVGKFLLSRGDINENLVFK